MIEENVIEEKEIEVLLSSSPSYATSILSPSLSPSLSTTLSTPLSPPQATSTSLPLSSLPLSSSLSSSQPIIEEDTFFCLICFDENKVSESFRLSCGHSYCLTCLQSFLESNIVEGKIILKCFHVENSTDENHENKPQGQSQREIACNQILSEEIIKEILANHPTVLAKYSRFLYLKSNTYGRECPLCFHLQTGDPNHPMMTCEDCGTDYCLVHAQAHPKTMSCESYEKSISAETQVNVEAITLISKPCPGCGIFVSKSDGCNHMKCPNCGSSFCWLCGKAIDDSVFPTHFQWWNLTGCANMQMVEDIVPSRGAIIFARITALLQTIVIGPLSVVSSIVSILTCCLCIPCITERSKFEPLKFFENCVVGWGFFWLFLLFFVPSGIIVGVIFLIVVLLLAPCYIYQKVKRGQIPYLTCQQCLNDLRQLFTPPRPPPNPQQIPIGQFGSASTTSSSELPSPLNATTIEPPIHNNGMLERVSSRRYSRRISTNRNSSRGNSIRSLSLHVYCPDGHALKGYSQANGPQNLSTKIENPTIQEEPDLENQVPLPSDLIFCQGKRCSFHETKQPVEYVCDCCHYYLCEQCYDDELKILNHIPINYGKQKNVELDSIKGLADLETGFTESIDTEEELASSMKPEERQTETMSVLLESDSYSISNTEQTEENTSLVGHPFHRHLRNPFDIKSPSEDTSSNSDRDSLSIHHFKNNSSTPLLHLNRQYISQDSCDRESADRDYGDSLKDEGSLTSSMIRQKHSELPVEDDDNMTSVSTIHSGSVDISSISGYTNRPLSFRRSFGIYDRKYLLQHDIEEHDEANSSSIQDENSTSVGGIDLIDRDGDGPTSTRDDQSLDEGHSNQHQSQSGDAEEIANQIHVNENTNQEIIMIENDDEDNENENGRGERLDSFVNPDENDDERASDPGLDDDMSIGSIDSTKCYPNNFSHSTGYFTIASLHKTDSPSNYLLQHLSGMNRYGSANRRHKYPSHSTTSYPFSNPTVEGDQTSPEPGGLENENETFLKKERN